MSLNLNLEDVPEVIYDRFNNPLKEGTEVLVNGYRPTYGFMEGEISKITDKCIFVDTMNTITYSNSIKRNRRRISKEYCRNEIINLEALNKLTDAKTDNT